MRYRIAKGWRIFAGVVLAIFAAGGLFVIGKAFTELSVTRQIGWAVGMTVVVVGMITLAWLDAVRTLVVVDAQVLSITRLFKSRTVPLQDINGYRVGEKGAVFIELKNGSKRLRIPQYLERDEELFSWIRKKYENLDVLEKKKETEALLENDSFGLTRKDRKAHLAMAKKFDIAATIVGIGLLGWSIFYPEPFEQMMILLFLAPWLAVGITWYFKGLLKLYKAKKSPYPSTVQLMCMAVAAVVIVILRAYTLYGFGQNAWSMLAGGTLAATIICSTACRPAIAASGNKTLTYICIFVAAAVYSYSLLIFSNCYYDKSSITIYHVAVTDKRISSGKSTTYYVSLSPWGRYADGDEVSVSKDFYQNVRKEDSVSVFLHYGKWSIPWYRLGRWKKSY